MPRWVIDYVLLHELTHLLHSGHGPNFWAALESYPRTERARGFLEGVSYREERGNDGDSDDTDGADVDDDVEQPDALAGDDAAAGDLLAPRRASEVRDAPPVTA